MVCLAELRKQQVVDQKIYDQKLMENTMRKLAWEGLQKNVVIDGDTMIVKEQVRCWVLRFILYIGKTIFKPIFIAVIDHKITCFRVGEIHILNGIDTLGHPGYLKNLRFFVKNLLCLLFFLAQVILLAVPS